MKPKREKSVGGQLTMAALAMLGADEDRSKRIHFHSLDSEQRLQAIRRLSNAGHGPETIARTTGLSVETVKKLLAEAA